MWRFSDPEQRRQSVDHGGGQRVDTVQSVNQGFLLAAWPPLSGLKLAATNVLFPHRSLADHFLLAETETRVIVAAKNRACCPGLRISKAAMKMLWR